MQSTSLLACKINTLLPHACFPVTSKSFRTAFLLNTCLAVSECLEHSPEIDATSMNNSIF